MWLQLGRIKDASCCFEQILEVAPYKTAVVQSPISHLINYSSKMDKTCWALPEKQIWIHKQCSPVDSAHTSTSWSAKTYIHQLCVDIGAVSRTCWEWWSIETDEEWESRDSMMSYILRNRNDLDKCECWALSPNSSSSKSVSFPHGISTFMDYLMSKPSL